MIPANSGITPETTITPPTPTSPSRAIRGSRSGSVSNTPSKLSQSMTTEGSPAPPGHTMDAVEENGGSSQSTIAVGTSEKYSGTQGGNVAGGFFQSMISAAQNAAQNAATTLSNTVTSNITKGESRTGSGANTPDVGRSRSGTETEKSRISGEVSSSMADLPSDAKNEEQPRKRLAVETLGQGELSLGSLGILPNSSKVNLSKNTSGVISSTGSSDNFVVDGTPESKVTSEDPHRQPQLGGESLEEATSQRLPTNTALPKTPMADDAAFSSSPAHGHSPNYENTTPNADGDRDEWILSPLNSSVTRSASTKSTRAASKTKRPRGSSAASTLTNNLQAPTAQLQPPASPTGSGPGPKITGFAVASKRRNRDFHILFRSVPEDDYLIEDYGCALQRDILLHGRLYVSEGHICFNSNILGWVNTLVINFDEVVAIEKRSTALLFPNGIVIQTLHARNVFASFISRDTTYELLVNIWKISHPGLIPSVTGYMLEKQPDNKVAGAGDEIERDRSHSESGTEEEYDEDEEAYDIEDNDEQGPNEQESILDDHADSGRGDLTGGVSSASNGATTNTNGTTAGVRQDATATGEDGQVIASGTPDAAKTQDYPGPVTHPVTDCGDHELHYDRVVCDEYLPGPLGKVYALLFGSQSHAFLTKFLEDQKVMELSIPNNAGWTPSPEAGAKSTRSYSYIRPLPGGIGPKQTKCICTEQLEQMDLEKAVSVLVTTETPDVPSGNVFCVRTRYCLTWGDGSMTGSAAETRMQLNCTVEWSGRSWLKVPIEKGCNDGQLTHGKDLTAALKKELEKSAGTGSKSRGKGGLKGRKKNHGVKGDQVSNIASAVAQKAAREKEAREREQKENAAWGFLLPLKPVLEPLVEVVPGGGVGLSVVLAVLLVVVSAFMGILPFFGRKSAGAGGSGSPGTFLIRGFDPGSYLNSPVWEQSWYAEEQGIWDWLEDRVGLHSANMGGIPDLTQEERRLKSWSKLRKMEKNQVLDKIRGVGGMADREVEEAVRVMEKRLEVFKGVMNERRREKKLVATPDEDPTGTKNEA